MSSIACREITFGKPKFVCNLLGGHYIETVWGNHSGVTTQNLFNEFPAIASNNSPRIIYVMFLAGVYAWKWNRLYLGVFPVIALPGTHSARFSAVSSCFQCRALGTSVDGHRDCKPRFCRADLGWIFYFGLANFRKVAGKFWWRFFSAIFFDLVSPGPPKNSCPKSSVFLSNFCNFHFLEPEICSRRFLLAGETNKLSRHSRESSRHRENTRLKTQFSKRLVWKCLTHTPSSKTFWGNSIFGSLSPHNVQVVGQLGGREIVPGSP